MSSVKLPQHLPWPAPVTVELDWRVLPRRVRPTPLLSWEGSPIGVVAGAEGMLDDLCALTRPLPRGVSSEARALAFARSYGPWSPCGGTDGHTHRPLAYPMPLVLRPEGTPRRSPPQDYRRGDFRTEEPPSVLEAAAQVANSWRRLLVALRSGVEPAREDLRHFVPGPPFRPPSDLGTLLGAVVADWMESFHVRLWLDERGGTFSPAVRLDGVGAAVAYGLYRHLVDERGRLEVCATCRATWCPKRSDHGPQCKPCLSARHGREFRRRAR